MITISCLVMLIDIGVNNMICRDICIDGAKCT